MAAGRPKAELVLTEEERVVDKVRDVVGLCLNSTSASSDAACSIMPPRAPRLPSALFTATTVTVPKTSPSAARRDSALRHAISWAPVDPMRYTLVGRT